MNINIECVHRLGFIQELCDELIDGETYNHLHILLYILVKDNDLIIDGFDHRWVVGGELYVADKVRHRFGHRPLELPPGLYAIENPRLTCGRLVMKEVRLNDYW